MVISHPFLHSRVDDKMQVDLRREVWTEAGEEGEGIEEEELEEEDGATGEEMARGEEVVITYWTLELE